MLTPLRGVGAGGAPLPGWWAQVCDDRPDEQSRAQRRSQRPPGGAEIWSGWTGSQPMWRCSTSLRVLTLGAQGKALPLAPDADEELLDAS